MSNPASIAVIGAGVQGCSIAIALAERGHPVDVYDQADAAMQRASLWNEGKLHLGYVYARDGSFNTAKAMIKGSLDFYEFFKTYLGHALDEVGVSSPFNYVVHKDSLLTPDEVFGHLTACQTYLNQELSSTGQRYWGQKQLSEPVRYSNSDLYNSRLCQAVYSVPEISIDTHKFAALICGYIDRHPLIHLHAKTALSTISRHRNRSFELQFNGQIKSYEKVINTSWESRLRFDAQLSYPPPHKWLHRYKVGCHIKGANVISTPSTTIVLGPFGDLVNFMNGQYYVSWYPTGKIGESTSISPPEFGDQLTLRDRQRLVSCMFESLGEILPEVKEINYRSAELSLKGGHIFAWGTGGIDQYTTQLHERHTTGVFYDHDYFSVNTGKFCSASLHTRDVLKHFA